MGRDSYLFLVYKQILCGVKILTSFKDIKSILKKSFLRGKSYLFLVLSLAYGFKIVYNTNMAHVWDYDIKSLKKSKRGQLLLLERQINYGVYPSDKEKIKLSEVKRHWNELNIEPKRRRLLELLIWKK